MPLLNNVVTREYGEYRDVYTNRKAPARYDTLYVAKRISAEDQEILRKYYLSEHARQRLQIQANSIFTPFQARRARRALGILASYDESGLCIRAKIWWRDKGKPKHPFSTIQWRMFANPLNRSGASDITGGLGFWVSERGRAKNKVLHEIIDGIVISYLMDVMPRYHDAVQGLLTDEMRQAIIDEIGHRADVAVALIVAARDRYEM